MRFDESHESSDVIDRRGEGPADEGPAQAGGGIGGLLFLLPWLIRTPFGWVVIVGALAIYLAQGLFTQGSPAPRAHGGSFPQSAEQTDATEVHFVSFVLDDVQHSWETDPTVGQSYRHAKLVLYTDSTRTGCGLGDAATGPFYCPADERVYIDLGFYRELAGRLGARGQFAQAYVIAHEVGHHVQKLLGLSQRVDAAHHVSGATSPSVRLELQADCFAGVWAHSTAQRSLLEAGDIESALGAAAAVGDDRLQRMARGTVSPESWTHGSSQQRTRWFKRGFDTGSVAACETFGAAQL